MSEPNQQRSQFAISSVLGEDALLLDSLTGREELGRLFQFEAIVVSVAATIDADQLLGTNVTVRATVHDGNVRYFNGYVSEFSALGGAVRAQRYKLTLRPWLWFLDQISDCRIYQDQSIPDVISGIFSDYGFQDYRHALTQSYAPAPYCVQYGETCFNFISRLLEQEGIYYYFEHQDGKHVLVLSDDMTSHQRTDGYEQVPYYPPELNRDRDHISDWTSTQTLQPTNVATNDYDPLQPRKSLLSRASVARQHEVNDLELFEYPGRFDSAEQGERYARIALEGRQSRYSTRRGAGSVRGLGPGMLFDLTGHPDPDQNQEYLITSADYVIDAPNYENAPGAAGDSFTTRLTTVPVDSSYRSLPLTPRPRVYGPQTAMVTGPAGEEIHTDEHGRIKVHFFWDRYSTADEHSSVWIRVVQNLAGNGFGAMYLPRIGQECLVEFLHGDPDQPLVTGCLYNGDNRVPYSLPDNKSVSGLRSNSTKDSSGHNELRFEDKAGSEQIYLHGQRNLDLRVGNNRYESIGGSRHLDVTGDRFDTVEGERHETIGGAVYEQIGADYQGSIGGHHVLQVKGDQTVETSGDRAESVGGDQSLAVSGDAYLRANNLVLEAMSSITINVGSSYIAIDNAGIKISTAGSIELDAGTELNATAQISAKVNGAAKAELSSSGTTAVTGMMVQIN